MAEDPEQLEPPDPQSERLHLSEVEHLELLRRSPHPYHRRQPELRRLNPSSPSSATDDSPNPSSGNLARSYSNKSITQLDEDGRNRRRGLRSPSESGTEADDEGYGLVKALPAPPARPRKGLRDTRGSGCDTTASPLLTPSLVDEEGRKYSTDYFKSTKGGAQTGKPIPTNDEAIAARQKYLKRRRAELIRRATEIALLGLISFLVVWGCNCWQLLLRWHREIGTHVAVLITLSVIYPLRLLRYSKTRYPSSKRRLKQRIRIPAAFDPAPILYPAIVPLLISISLFSSLEKILLPNLILGLAALPPGFIPYGKPWGGYSAVHWFISALPLIASQNTELPSKLFPPIPYMLKLPPPEGLHPEILVTLFALHHALLPPLHYLTTTSLLPAELHLLSIGLINILLFASSPQTQILKVLLWIGGLGIFVLCGNVLKWGVALARIPRWRFRHVGNVISARQSFLQMLTDSLNAKRSVSADGKRSTHDSDADEDDPRINEHNSKSKGLKLVLDPIKSSFRFTTGAEPSSAMEQTHPHSLNQDTDIQTSPRRRNTLPPTLPNNTTPLQNLTTTIRQRSRSTLTRSFLSLTPQQATTRKWLYATYFYLTVILLILLPIRHFISIWALSSHEPIGWALGYLFSNIQSLRFFVVNWDLESWIPFPPLPPDPSTIPLSDTGIANHLRLTTIGPANTRVGLISYFIAIISFGLLIVSNLSSIVEVDTRRKVFHGMMVLILLPTIFIDPCFISLALILVLAIFLLLDLVRASQLPPLSRPIATFLTPYVDGRDLRGPVVVSHIFLLVGCAVPLWLGCAGVERVGGDGIVGAVDIVDDDPWLGWDVASRDVSMLAGVVCVGMGDAAASLVGRRFGRRKWPWAGGKSLEGSLAFAGAVMVGLVAGKVWLWVGGWDGRDGHGWDWSAWLSWVVVVAKAVLCAAAASLNEAVLTGGNDNVVVPVVLWLVVRGVGL